VSTKNEKEGVFVSAQSSILIFVAGVFVGVLLMLIRPKNKREKKQKFDFKDEKQLLMKLLPYKENMDVQNIIDTIEGNLYLGKKETLVKKEVKEILEKYNIS
jgi:cbb3-type cytochrome oxidase subunit 3